MGGFLGRTAWKALPWPGLAVAGAALSISINRALGLGTDEDPDRKREITADLEQFAIRTVKVEGLAG